MARVGRKPTWISPSGRWRGWTLAFKFTCCEKWRLHPSGCLRKRSLWTWNDQNGSRWLALPAKQVWSVGKRLHQDAGMFMFWTMWHRSTLPFQSRFSWVNEPGQKDGRGRWASWDLPQRSTIWSRLLKNRELSGGFNSFLMCHLNLDKISHLTNL